jgi:hypothetical protein
MLENRNRHLTFSFAISQDTLATQQGDKMAAPYGQGVDAPARFQLDFIHAADVHLDSPLHGLAHFDDAIPACWSMLT